MRVKCETCGIEGYLQVLGNYARIRHYSGIDPTNKKSKFYYHQQSKAYIESLGIKSNDNRKLRDMTNNSIGHLNTTIDQRLNHNESFLNKAGGVGFEPTTTDLGGRCSVRTELR